jgi:hypothetical protein
MRKEQLCLRKQSFVYNATCVSIYLQQYQEKVSEVQDDSFLATLHLIVKHYTVNSILIKILS